MFQFANPTVFNKLSQYYFLTSKRTLQNVNSTTIPNLSFYLKFNIWFDTMRKFHNVKSSTKYNLLRRVKCHQTNSPLPSHQALKNTLRALLFFTLTGAVEQPDGHLEEHPTSLRPLYHPQRDQVSWWVDNTVYINTTHFTASFHY